MHLLKHNHIAGTLYNYYMAEHCGLPNSFCRILAKLTLLKLNLNHNDSTVAVTKEEFLFQKDMRWFAAEVFCCCSLEICQVILLNRWVLPRQLLNSGSAPGLWQHEELSLNACTYNVHSADWELGLYFLFAKVEEKSWGCWVGVWAGGVYFDQFLLINANVFLIYSSCAVSVYLLGLHARVFLSVRIFRLNFVCLFACLCKCVLLSDALPFSKHWSL